MIYGYIKQSKNENKTFLLFSKIFHFFTTANEMSEFQRELIEMYEGLAGGSKWLRMTDMSDIVT